MNKSLPLEKPVVLSAIKALLGEYEDSVRQECAEQADEWYRSGQAGGRNGLVLAVLKGRKMNDEAR